MNEACFLYTGCKPIVCAHDSAVSGIRVTSNRLKILKLHGDFLYDSIKNTIKETDVLEKNMQSKFMQFSREYGLIVIGYGGNDRSIMDILDSMVRPSEPEPYFPNGLYWCHRKGGKISKKLDRLLQREKAYLVEIDGFDEFMAELHQFLGCSLPASVRDPYKATTDRLNSFVSEKAIDHPVIRQHANELENQIKGFEKAISGTPAAEDLLNLVPYGLLTKLAFDKNRHEDVLTYGCKALEKDPDNIMTVYMMGVSYIALERPDEALKVCEDILAKKPGDFLGSKLKGTALNHMGKIEDAISVHNEIIAGRKITASERASSYTSLANCFLLKGDWQSALENSEKALELDPEGYNSIGNKCLALKNIGRFEEAKEILTKTLPKIQDDYTKACYLATLEEKDKMLKHLAEAIRKDRYLLASAKFDPDFNAYRSDPEFRKLVYDERKERGNSQQTSTSKS